MTHPNPDPLYVPELDPAPLRRGITWGLVIEVVIIAVLFALVVAFLAPRAAAMSKESAPSLNSVEPNVSSLPLATVSGLSGTATWYCGQGSDCTAGYGPLDMVAAIDPTTGIDKGTRVRVTHDGRSVVVVVVDVCACAGERIIDLTSGAFLRLAPTSIGVIPVTLETLGKVKLPDTSTAP